MLKNKNAYEKMYHEYKKRIQQHKDSVKFLTKKVRVLKKIITLREKRQEKLRTSASYIKDFFEVNVHKIGGNIGRKKNEQIAKSVFYKYCIENGIRGSYIADYCGLKCKETPCKQRKCFTRSFKTNPENKEIYHRFLIYVKQNKI